MPMEAREILPIECWESIISYLSDDGLKVVSLVCKDFLTISNICKDGLKVIHPGIGMLSKQLNRFKYLKKIDMKLFTGDLDEAILEIARSDQVNIEILDMSFQVAFKTESLRELGSNSKMKNLKALYCTAIQRLQDDDLVVIANSFPNLEELDLGYYRLWCPGERASAKNISDPSTFPTDYGVESLASKLKLLKKIKFSGIYDLTDRSVVALSLNCVFLKAVTICSDSLSVMSVTQNGIGLLLRNSPNLEALKIGFIEMMGYSQSTITIENSISYAKALTSLTFFQMYVSDMLLNAIAKAKLPLKKLGLRLCENFTVSGLLMVLSKSNFLTKLRILRSNIKDVDMVRLLNGSDLGKLTHLDISQSQVTFSTLFQLSTKCPSLVEIRMDNTKIGDGDLYNIQLSKNHRIRNLYVRGCGIGDESVKQFGLMFPNLRILDLSFCSHVTSTGTEAILKSCKFLRKLILSGYEHAKLIKSEFPAEVNLEDLTLSYSEIDDKGLAAIAKLCPRLVYLDLTYCLKTTAEGIKQIVKNITTLNCLHMRTCDHKTRDLLEWMLSTGNLASLKKIYVGLSHKYFSEEQRDEFLHHGCLLIQW
ncbi:hypothetical protein REPUB_Repub05bG0037300 [Reevesia pubescens]